MNNPELQHHGIKGQKWGRRRFQTSDGSLTAAGRKRYADDDSSGSNKSKTSSKIESSTSAKKKTASKKKTSKKSADGIVAGLGKAFVANVARYRQNRQTYNAVSSMLSGDFGSASYSSLMSRSYGNINRFLYD